MTKKSLIKILKTVVPLAVGVFLIYYSINSATPEQRELLWKNIKNANPWWILLSFFFGLLSHVSRAYRWKFMLEPMGYPTNMSNRFMAVMVAYLANLGIPRSGEVLRGATLTTYEQVPFEKAFGTIISERLADFIMLMIVVVAAIFMQRDDLLMYLKAKNINPLWTGAVLVGGIIFLFVLFRLFQRSKHGLAVKIRGFLTGLVEGMRSILKMKKKAVFIFHTFFIWTMYILMFWVIKFTVPELVDAPAGVMLAAFVVGSFSISATNGGIGVYPVALGALLVVFEIPRSAGEAFGWIIWGTQTLLVVVLGALSFILLPICNRD